MADFNAQAGLLGDAFSSPLFNFGVGLLSASGPSTTPISMGQALAQGGQMASQAQRQQLQNQLIRAKLTEDARQQAALGKLRELISAPASTIPQQDAAAQFGGGPEGLLAAEAGDAASRQRQMMGLLAEVAPAQFAQGLLAQMVPQKPTTLQREYEFLRLQGVPHEKALEALKKGTVVNVGSSKLDEPLSASDLLKVRMPDGSTPPLGATARQIREAGGTVMGDTQQKALDAAEKFGGILDKLEDLALGEDGVFTNVASGLSNRVQSGLNLFISSLNRSNPNIEAYESLAQGTIAPFIRQLGETGALAEGDTARGLGLLPQIRDSFLLPDTREDAVNKLDALRDLLEKGVGNLREMSKKTAPAAARKKPRVIDFNDLSE